MDRDRPVGGRDHVDRAQVVAAEAESAGQWAQPAAQQVARDAHARCRTAHGGETVRRRGREHRFPGAPGTDPRGTGGDVDIDGVQAPDRERQTVADVVQTAMAGTEHGHRPTSSAATATVAATSEAV